MSFINRPCDFASFFFLRALTCRGAEAEYRQGKKHENPEVRSSGFMASEWRHRKGKEAKVKRG